MSVEVTCKIEFECCYLVDTELNAHRYQFEVTVNGRQRLQDNGTVIEFETLHHAMKEVAPRNAFLFDTSSNNVGRDIAFIMGQRGVKVVGVGFPLSAENICSHLVYELQDNLNKLNPGVTVTYAALRETPKSYVSWKPDFRFVAN